MKKYLCALLALLMVLTLVPVSALGAIVEGEPNLYFRIGEDKNFYYGMGRRITDAPEGPIRFYTAENGEALIRGSEGFRFPENGGAFTYLGDDTWSWDPSAGQPGGNYHIYYTDEDGEEYYAFCDIYSDVEDDLLKAGYTAPDIRVYGPEGLEEGVDYLWDYTDGILTVTALKGEAAHWQAAYEAARDGNISLSFTVPIPEGAVRAATYCGNGPSMPDYVSGDVRYEPLWNEYSYVVPFASINEHNGAVTVTPTTAYSGVRMAQVFDDSNSGNGVLAKYLVRTRVEIPESFAHHPEYKFRPSFEPQPMPAAGIVVELKSSQNWDVAISDGLAVLTPKEGYTLADLRRQNRNGIAQIFGEFWWAYGMNHGDQSYYLAEHSDGHRTWYYTETGHYDSWGDGIGGDQWDGKPFTITFTTTWRGKQGGEIYDYVTVIVTDNVERKPYMSLLPKSQVTELSPSIDQAVPSGGNVTVDYNAATGYYHTSFAEGAILRPEDVTVHVTMEPLPGAKTYRVMNQEGPRDPREGGRQEADNVAWQIAVEPLHDLGKNDTRMLELPLVNYDVMRLDGHDVYFSLTRSFTRRTVAWYSDTAGKNLLGYTYIFGHNDDFVCVTTGESQCEVTGLVDRPTLESEESLKLTCELYPTGGKGQFMQLWVNDESKLGENNVVYLPFAYFGLTNEEGLALAAGKGDLTYAVIRHYREDYSLKSGEKGLIFGEFTPYGVKFVTDSFSPFMATTVTRGDLNARGDLDVLDMQMLYEHLTGAQPITEDFASLLADVNGDGVINILDYQALYEAIK